MVEKNGPRAVATADAGKNKNPTNCHVIDYTGHPLERHLKEDTHACFRWHPAYWNEQDRERRQPATGADVLDLREEVAVLQGQIEALRAQIAEPQGSGNESPNQTDPPKVHVPPHVRRNIRRRRRK